MQKIPFRYLPIPTADFLEEMRKCDKFVYFETDIGTVIRRHNRHLVPPFSENLGQLILHDLLHHDVPFLTTLGCVA